MKVHKTQIPVITYHPNGEVKSMENYNKNNQRHGLRVWRYENGQKEFETNHKDGKIHGMTSYWYENGRKKAAGYYVLGERYASIDWNEEGNIISTNLPTQPHRQRHRQPQRQPTTDQPLKTSHKPKTQPKTCKPISLTNLKNPNPQLSHITPMVR